MDIKKDFLNTLSLNFISIKEVIYFLTDDLMFYKKIKLVFILNILFVFVCLKAALKNGIKLGTAYYIRKKFQTLKTTAHKYNCKSNIFTSLNLNEQEICKSD